MVTAPAKGSLSIADNGTFTYTPSADATGNDSFTFKASDGSLESNTGTVDIIINESTEVPTGDAITREFGNSTYSDVPGAIEETFTNINSTILEGSDTVSTWSWSSPTPHKIANTIILKADLSSIPSSAIIEEASLTLYQTASHGESVYSNSVHRIAGRNPVISEVSGYNAAAGLSWSEVAAGTTYDSVPLGLADIGAAEDTIDLDTTPGYKTWSITAMVRDWVSNPSVNFGLLIKGEETNTETGRTFAASEYSDGNMRPSLTITYRLAAEAGTVPTANDMALQVQENSEVSSQLNVDNPDGNTLVYKAVTQPVNGTLTIEESTGSFTYSPASNYFGIDSFTYNATNDAGISNTATVTLTISSVNDSTALPSLSFEVGEISVDSSLVRVNFSSPFSQPVIIANTLTRNDTAPSVIRISDVDAQGFNIQIQPYDYLNSSHRMETVSYLVMEKGSYTLDDGTQIEAGLFNTDATTFAAQTFVNQLNAAPVVFTSIITSNGSDAVVGRVRNISTTGFEYQLQEQEANEPYHILETVAYLAWTPGSGTTNGIQFQVGNTSDAVSHENFTINFNQYFTESPFHFAGMQTTDGGDTASVKIIQAETAGMEIMVEEEASKDSETNHTNEIAGFLVLLPE